MSNPIDDLFNEAMAFNLGGGVDFPGNESVTYLPFAGAPRPITANVTRYGLKPVRDGDGNLLVPKFTIVVANHPALGITDDELNSRGADRMRIKKHQSGADTEDLGIYIPQADSGIVWCDAATLTLFLG